MGDDEEEDGAGDDEGGDEELFTVVDGSDAREAMERRERQRRCKATTDPEKEAVNAKLGMSFVCRICDHVHYPEKPPPTSTRTKSGKKRYIKKPLPDACTNSIPIAEGLEWMDNDRLTISAGKKIELPGAAEGFEHGPMDNEDQCMALANIDGYIERMRELFRAVRQAAIDAVIKTPFTERPRATRIKRSTEAASGCPNALSGVSEVYIGTEDVITVIREWMFPATTLLTLGASDTRMLDITDDFKMVLLHMHSKMTIHSGRKNEQNVYVQARQELEKNPNIEFFHEHYLCISTNPINRDCEIYEVPETVVTIADARKLVEAGKARKVR